MKKEIPINSNADFWEWFVQNEKSFHKVVKNEGDISNDFFSKLSPKLDALKKGYWFLAGMFDADTAELILTADGDIKNIAFIEDLVREAPEIKGWRITALKPESGFDTSAVEMDALKFSKDTLHFYSNDLGDFPDEIDITITHPDLNEANSADVTNGVYLFLDNALGELKSVSVIDNLEVISEKAATAELVPIEKLNAFLIWREKEFIEKYEGVRHSTENDNYSALEASLKSGFPLLAVVNMDLLNWDSKASHPWIAEIELEYKGISANGMPDEATYELLNTIEDEIIQELKDADGYLNIGRQTAENVREVYFACADFRKPSKVFYQIQQKYSNRIKIEFDIYKDKYWQSFDRFLPR
ncbi:DUF695 domain-containing protein [Algibacter miyuki]|uniref:DUF695 domain-containing protein n=1 Tax=Algibacter miyuki TaxID=1306933 RepID=A0ABV5H0U5_9FLAO|nr:DUF695 domain-containing protein [Algibacter miyuki]MDN3664100.1 DUF695 domain-containing protein [Algibacter miyuki]